MVSNAVYTRLRLAVAGPRMIMILLDELGVGVLLI
jgi:hypothetical protein